MHKKVGIFEASSLFLYVKFMHILLKSPLLLFSYFVSIVRIDKYPGWYKFFLVQTEKNSRNNGIVFDENGYRHHGNNFEGNACKICIYSIGIRFLASW